LIDVAAIAAPTEFLRGAVRSVSFCGVQLAATPVKWTCKAKSAGEGHQRLRGGELIDALLAGFKAK
jgi:hypothetical protein